MSIAIALHVLAVVIWVGGMFFAYVCLRPVAATQLEPPQRLSLWQGVFAHFFPWVWACVALILGSGYWIIFGLYGGMATTPVFIHIMQGLGLVMMAIFAHVFFAPYRRLRRAVAEQRWPDGGKALNHIRQLVGLNLALGLITVIVATAGRYLL
ncbi:MAG TPA: CopD family protein [Thiolinea sp.]|nr:CopD family protein [Thiolinea sp.]